MTILTIEEAEKWMADNAQILGAAYVLRDPETEQLIRAYGGYLDVCKTHAGEPCVAVMANMLIGAINAVTTLEVADDMRRIALSPLTRVKGGE